MYNVYNNFQLIKEKDFVKITVESLLILENKNDDDLVSIKFPKCLDSIFESKIPTEQYEKYNVYILKITNPSKITDYKKVWKLGGFDADGLYDNYYDVDGGRIYLGITKEHPKFNKSVWMENISILALKEYTLPFEKIFNLFSINKYDLGFDKKKQDYVLSSLMGLIKNSIVINKISANIISLNLYGDKIEQKFDISVLPTLDVIER